MISGGAAIISTLMGLIAVLMWLARQSWAERLFRFVPVVVWAFFLAQALSGLGVIDSSSPTLPETSKLLAPFAIFLLTAGTSLREVRALRGAAVFMIAAASIGSMVGVGVAYSLFGTLVDPEMWRPLAALTAGWIGGSGNFVAVTVALDADPDLVGPVSVADSMTYLWLSFALFLSAHQERINRWIFPNAVPVTHNSVTDIGNLSMSETALTASALAITLGLAAIVTMISVAAGEALQLLFPNSGFSPFSWTLLVIVSVAVILSISRFQPLAAGIGAPVATYCFYLLMAIQGSQSSFSAIVQLGSLVPLVGTALLIHILVVVLAARVARQDAAMVAVSSWAAIGGAVTAPIVANAYRPALAPLALIMALVNYTTANYAGLLMGRILEFLAP